MEIKKHLKKRASIYAIIVAAATLFGVTNPGAVAAAGTSIVCAVVQCED